MLKSEKKNLTNMKTIDGEHGLEEDLKYSYSATTIGEAINNTLENVETEQSRPFGIPSGYISIDKHTLGWREGEVILIGSRPSVGKTAIALGLARNAAVDHNVPVAYFSLDLSERLLTERLIVAETGIDMGKLHGGTKMDASDLYIIESKLKQLARAPLFIDDTPGITLNDLRNRVATLASERHVKLFVVDYLQLIIAEGDKCPSGSRHKEFEDSLQAIYEMATTNKVAFIVLTNIRRPLRRNYTGLVLSDLNEYCPAAEDYAGRIILLHRPDLISLNFCDEKQYILECRIVKNKNGRTGKEQLLFDTERVQVIDTIETAY